MFSYRIVFLDVFGYIICWVGECEQLVKLLSTPEIFSTLLEEIFIHEESLTPLCLNTCENFSCVSFKLYRQFLALTLRVYSCRTNTSNLQYIDVHFTCVFNDLFLFKLHVMCQQGAESSFIQSTSTKRRVTCCIGASDLPRLIDNALQQLMQHFEDSMNQKWC